MEVAKKRFLGICPKTQVEADYMSIVPYQSIVGRLMPAMVSSRPDIAHTVSNVTQFSSDPGPRHWVEVESIFRYLQGTSKHGILFSGSPEESLKLTGSCGADWAGALVARDQLQGTVSSLEDVQF